ncbi:MAG: hypothetical protein E7163_04245 [Firmicutes bacterium]|nr:hypothetical protein [Bacillota bacterium]
MPYIITQETYALIPVGKKTKIIEREKIIIVNETPAEVVSTNCIINGSSLEGRQKGSSYLIGTTYKPPIIINDRDNIVLLPTHSIRNNECIWINLNSILNYIKNMDKTTILEFKNKKKINLKVSFTIFDKQVLKATRLESTLRGRNNQKYL